MIEYFDIFLLYISINHYCSLNFIFSPTIKFPLLIIKFQSFGIILNNHNLF